MKKIFEDFRKGIERLRWFATVFAERMKIEMAIFRLLYESDRIAKMREELLKKIGQRVLELKDHHDKNLLRDTLIAGALAEIGSLDRSIDELKEKVTEMSRVAE